MIFKKQIEKEKTELKESFPIFNPTYRKEYGNKLTILTIGMGLTIYVPLLIFTAPWKHGYSIEERLLLIVFVGVGGFILAPLFSSYPAAFIMNSIDLLKWHIEGNSHYTTAMKFLFLLIFAFAIVGAFLLPDGNNDVWGWFCFGMSAMMVYLFVTLAWAFNHSLREISQEGEPVAGGDATR